MTMHKPGRGRMAAGADSGADTRAAEPPALQDVVGSTLALMSFYARTPTLGTADGVARHLAILARHPQADASLQASCTRLFLEWLGPIHLQDLPAEHQWRDVMPIADGEH